MDSNGEGLTSGAQCSRPWLSQVFLYPLILIEILEDFVLGTFREAIILKKLEFYDKLSQTGEGEGSVRFHTHIQKWSKNFENGPNGPKKSQIT